MKITKFSVIIFISLMMIALFPPIAGMGTSWENVQPESGLDLNQVAVTPVFRDTDLNAVVRNYQRNITVRANTQVVLEDGFTLKVGDNETQISMFNYTIPSSYAQHVLEVDIYSQMGDSLGLVSSNNSRAFSVFYGHEVTTYSFDISENGFGANDTSGNVYFKLTFVALGIIDVDTYRSGQVGVFEVPVLPFLPNLWINDSTIGMVINSNGDKWDRDFEKITNTLLQPMPIVNDAQSTVSYTNMSRSPYSYNEGLLRGDVTTATFRSLTIIDPSNQDIPTVVVPNTIQNAERIVRFDPWGQVFVTERITIRHDGGERNATADSFQNVHQLSGIRFTIPSSGLVTDVYDELGPINLGPRSEETGYPLTTASGIPGKQDLDISFRNGIYGGQTYSLSFEYRFNASQVITIDSETNMYTLNTTLFSDFNSTIDNLSVRYQLPPGSVYDSNTYLAKSRFVSYSVFTQVSKNPLSSFKHLEVVYSMTDVSYIDNLGFQIVFSYNGTGHLQYLASFVYIGLFILLALAGLSSINYKPSRAIEIEKKTIPVDEMDAFFNLFSERTGAERRIAQLAVQKRKGKLSKKDYDGQVQAIRKRLRQLNPQLEAASKKLSEKGGRYENYVNRVMLASQRQSDIRRNIRDSKKDYDRGSIPKNIYQMKVKEFNQGLKNQEAVINKTLAEMVEVIQRFSQT